MLSLFSREMSAGRRFIPEMDGLRFFAIGIVVVLHVSSYLFTVRDNPYGFSTANSNFLARLAGTGVAGVELFFVISGFILALPFASYYLAGTDRVTLRKYYLRRISRIEPPYFVALLLIFLSIKWLGRMPLLDPAWHLLASLAYSHNFIYGRFSSILPAAWSLEVEIQFYILVPILALIFAVRRKLLRRGMLVAAIVLASCTEIALSGWHDKRMSLSLVAYLQFFLAGFLLADIFLTEWRYASSREFYWDAIALVCWPLLLASARTHWLLLPLIFVLCVAAFRGRISNRVVTNRWLTAIGGMCYSIYLLHGAAIGAVGRLTRKSTEGLPYSTHFVVQLLLVAPPVILVSAVFFLLVEKPCMDPRWPQEVWAKLTSSGTSAPVKVA
jgi:peptidoglycan/LPS O-acetylase OafA/YrhL